MPLIQKMYGRDIYYIFILSNLLLYLVPDYLSADTGSELVLRKLLPFLFVFLPTYAFAWGNLGHRVTAEIAYQHLSPKTKDACDHILVNERFVEIASWADGIKQDPAWHHTAWYHFTNVPDQKTYVNAVQSLPVERQVAGDAVMAILKSESILRSPSADLQSKAWALKFLIHLVGDLHQPLHSGRPEDKGGNEIPVNWFGQLVNLHEIWDTLMIVKAHSGDLTGKSLSEQSQWYANYLEKSFSQANNGASPPNLLPWLNGSLAIRSDAYKGSEDNSAYLTKSIPVLEAQLALGGYHLADTLNDLFDGGNNIADSEQGLRALINRAIGQPFENLILLGPKN